MQTTEESESAIRSIVDVVRQKSDKMGLSMNVKETNMMVVCHDETPDVRIVVNGQVPEQVKKFKYLGQWITDNGRCEWVLGMTLNCIHLLPCRCTFLGKG